MKIAAVQQPQFLPYLGFFHKMRQCDVFVMLDDVQFLKRSFQSRNKIKNSQGEQWLTVPVRRQFRPEIRNVEIDNEQKWRRRILNSLTAAYARATHFDCYEPELKEAFERDWQSLAALNDALMRWAMKVLKIETPVLYASDLAVSGAKSDLLVSICRAVGADHYLSGPGGRLYMETETFKAAGIEIIWQDFSPPIYEQLFPKVGFIPNLAVVDALFCCGAEETREFLSPNNAPMA